MIHHPLNAHHPLRATKAAKGRGALGVGFEPVRGNFHMRQIIGIIRVQHRPICHRQRQIQRPAAAEIMGKLQCLDPAAVIKADVIVNAAVMAFSGDDEIIITVIAHFARPPGERGRQRAGDSQRIALAFFAAKPASHAPHFHAHRMLCNIQRLCHLMLNFRWVLG